MNNYLTIGKLIKSARMRMEISQRTLAEKLDCSASLVNHFEMGKRMPELVDAFRMEQILKVGDKTISSAVIAETYYRATGLRPLPKIGEETKPLQTQFRAEGGRGAKKGITIRAEELAELLRGKTVRIE